MTDFVGFLKRQKPLCLGLPFHKDLISKNLYYELAERSEADFNGRNLFEQQCANAVICTSECRGRPIPMYPELSDMIKKYNPTVGEWGGHPVWLISVETCKTCPFKAQCTKLCPSMGAFEARSNNREDLYLDMSASLDEVEDEWLESLYYQEEDDKWVSKLDVTADDIAWDCLSEPQKAAVIMVLVQGKTLEQAAQTRGIHVNAIAKSYESGMARLKEFGLARKALKLDSSCKYAVEYYRGGVTQPDISRIYGVSQYTVSIKLREFREKHGLNP